MASDLLTKWFSWWQPLQAGLTRYGVANGLLLTGGLFWVRLHGGSLLYRGPDTPDQIDWETPVGSAGADARRIREFDWLPPTAPGLCWYGLRTAGPGGMLSSPGPLVDDGGAAGDAVPSLVRICAPWGGVTAYSPCIYRRRPLDTSR